MNKQATEFEFPLPTWKRLTRIKNSDVVVSVGSTAYSTIPAEIRAMNALTKLGIPTNLRKLSELPIYKYVRDNLEEVGTFIQFDSKSMYYPKTKLRRIIKRYLDEHAVDKVADSK